MGFNDDVRVTLLYFDLFDHPLYGEELFRFFPTKISFEHFKDMLARSDFMSSRNMFHLRNSNEIVSIRVKREKKARTMLYAAKLVGMFIRHFPFVRAAFLSGSLSKGINPGDADVDLFIISAEDRLWICRSFLTAFKKVFLMNSKKFLCPNYFMTEQHLEIPDKNIFTATELATLKPLYNAAKLKNLLVANKWVAEFYPNFEIPYDGTYKSRSTLQRLLELPMSDGYTSKWDGNLMHYFNNVWQTRYSNVEPEKRELLFRTTPYASKIHPSDFQTRVLDAYEERLRKENLIRLIRLDN